jgi:excisionase family DNA binding protein
MLTVKAVAERLGVSRGLVYALVRTGKLRAGKFGTGRGTIRIEEAALDEFRASSVVEPDVSPPRVLTSGNAAFENLDNERLIQAWKDQGAIR